MEFNQGKTHTDQILNEIERGKRGIRKAIRSIENIDRLVKEAEADPELKADVQGYANACGTSLTQIKAEQKKLQELATESIGRFPELAPPEPAAEPV